MSVKQTRSGTLSLNGVEVCRNIRGSGRVKRHMFSTSYIPIPITLWVCPFVLELIGLGTVDFESSLILF